jgi:hypothetical protein
LATPLRSVNLEKIATNRPQQDSLVNLSSPTMPKVEFNQDLKAATMVVSMEAVK